MLKLDFPMAPLHARQPGIRRFRVTENGDARAAFSDARAFRYKAEGRLTIRLETVSVGVRFPSNRPEISGTGQGVARSFYKKRLRADRLISADCFYGFFLHTCSSVVAMLISL